MKSTNYLLIKLAFRTPVHFGKGRLATSEMTIGADRLFSSLYQQALKTPEGERLAEQLVASVKNGTLRLSDTFPYMENKWYLPKPVMRLTLKKEGNAIQKKSLKKLSFIPSALFPAFHERAFPAAVFADNTQIVSGLQRKVDIVANRAPVIGKAEVFAMQ
jgi:CRISPR-associated protein Csm4